MAAVIGGSFEEVKTFCDEFDVEIANLNCPGQIVVSGEKAKVLKAVEGAKGRFKLCKPLNVAGAYHSRLMNPAKEAFAKFIETIEFKTPEIAVYTNVTGERVTNPQVMKEALASQIISPVRFEDCLRNMAAESKPDVLYECGPGKVLAGFGKRIDKALNIVPVSEFSDLPN
jgi:[acyl-carrier-protein] S-malonyltransferase